MVQDLPPVYLCVIHVHVFNGFRAAQLADLLTRRDWNEALCHQRSFRCELPFVFFAGPRFPCLREKKSRGGEMKWFVSILTSGVSLIPNFCFALKTFHISYSKETRLLGTTACFFKCSSLAILCFFPISALEGVPVLNLEMCVCTCGRAYMWVCAYIPTYTESLYWYIKVCIHFFFPYSLCHLDKAFCWGWKFYTMSNRGPICKII